MHGHAFSFTQQPEHLKKIKLAAHTEVGVQVGLAPLVMCCITCNYVTEFMSATSIWLLSCLIVPLKELLIVPLKELVPKEDWNSLEQDIVSSI